MGRTKSGAQLQHVLGKMGGKDVKALSAILAIAILATLIGSTGAAREAARPGLRMMREDPEAQLPGLVDPGLRGLYEEAAVDTYCLVWYDFEIKNWQGWTRDDQTAQRGTYFHVDDFAGLAGYAALEGEKSMWCGARKSSGDPYLCSWATAAGYGNGWEQMLTTNPMSPVGALTFSYKIAYDTEAGYDYVRVEYDGINGWETAAEYTGQNDTIVSLFLPLTSAQTKLRFRFTSDGAWSDEDGLYETNGACMIDSIGLSDSGTFSNFEDFEAAAIGANEAGIWHGRPGVSFGMYSGLQCNLNDKDPCGDDLTSMIVFFIGSGVPSTTYPGLYDTPYCKGSGGYEAPCQNEMVISPPIDTRRYSTGRNGVQDGVIPPGELPSLAGFLFRFTVYQDSPFSNLVYYQWHVRNIEDGCPGQWLDIFGAPAPQASVPAEAEHTEEDDLDLAWAKTFEVGGEELRAFEPVADEPSSTQQAAIPLPPPIPVPPAAPSVPLREEIEEAKKTGILEKRGAGRRVADAADLEKQFIRVNIDRLDNLMNLVGEMIVNRNRLAHQVDFIKSLREELAFSQNRLIHEIKKFEEKYEYTLSV